jgi:FkbM family methyltransferase
MSLRKFTHDFFRIFGLKFERTISSIGNKLAVYGLKKKDYKLIDRVILFKELELEIPIAKAIPLLENYPRALLLKQRGNFKFFINDDGELSVKNNELKFQINDEEELYILKEIFLEGAYNLISATDKKIALIDIGMNVGITTLFYASKENVEKVFSFEPFSPTFSMALKNIQLNKLYASKIKPNNFGLGSEEREMHISYSTKHKGRMSLTGLPEMAEFSKEEITTQLIHLKSAKEEILKIKNDVTDNFVICKIDTEGAEYEIIDSLYNAGLLSIADVYFIEWHKIIPFDIVVKLKENNFNIIETSFSSLNTGMIYAFKKNL